MAKMDPDEVRRRLEREAEQEEAIRAQSGRDAKMDMAFDAEFFELTGLLPSDIAGIAKDMPDLVDTDEAMRVIKRGKKEWKKGNRAKAQKIFNSNKDVKKIAKQAKKGKGCAIVALLTLGSAGTSVATIYATIEIIGRMMV